MRQNLLEVAGWCCEHKLLINPSKAKYVIFGTRQLQHSVEIERSIPFLGKDLSALPFANDLGEALTLYYLTMNISRSWYQCPCENYGKFIK